MKSNNLKEIEKKEREKRTPRMEGKSLKKNRKIIAREWKANFE